jgi:ABC-2 type transport system ATP-binding protein
VRRHGRGWITARNGERGAGLPDGEDEAREEGRRVRLQGLQEAATGSVVDQGQAGGRPGRVLRIAGVRKSFGRAPVLRGVDLELARGELLGLAGVNGAGKTTLVKCLLDFCGVDAGTIEIDGVPHTEPRSRAGLAFVPERFTPPYYLTGMEFLGYMSRLAGVRWSREEAEAMLAELDFDPAALARTARTYSKGMTQKLGLAAAFLERRDLYVLDEPMSGLDPRARAGVKKLLGGLRKRGASLLFTSHSLADVEEVCDRMAILHGGVRFFAGTPKALCDHYRETSLERAFLRCISGPVNV